MTTKIPVELSSTPGIVDSSNATAITIDSSENISINSGDVTLATASKRYYVPRASDAAATGSLYSPADSDIRLSGAGSSAGELQFEPSSTSGVTVTITSAGKVGIRDTTPDAVLKVNSTGGGSELAFKVADASDNSVFEVQGGGTAVFQYGHVGIANTSPGSYDSNARNLVVGSGTGDEGMTIASGGGSGGRIYFADGTGSDAEKADGYIFYNHASQYMAFGTVATERMRIESTGDIRFGISNAALTAAEVHTMYNGSKGNNLALYTQGGSSFFSIDMWNHTGGSCNQVQFRGGGSGAVTGTITSTGNNATQYNTSSDYRLKENVDYTWDATTRLKQLKPVRFNWIDDDTNTLEDGFLAHEVSSVVPNAVTGEKDAVYTEEEASNDIHINVGDIKRQQLDHSKLVPLLVKTIQELEARITTLEGE